MLATLELPSPSLYTVTVEAGVFVGAYSIFDDATLVFGAEKHKISVVQKHKNF
jgi:hypothetical protein